MVRQIANALTNRQNRFETAVVVEYPRKDVCMVGFVTGDSPEPVGAITKMETVTVFIPNSPNPTWSRLVLVPEDQVYDAGISVRQAAEPVG
jgi:uncharacterized membrane protein